MRAPHASFEQWLKWVFDHPPAPEVEKEWWWAIPYPEEGGRWLDRPPWRAIKFMTRLFEDPVPYLALYKDEQIDQGLWFVLNTANSDHAEALTSNEVSKAWRRRCIRATVALYGKLLAPRCSEAPQRVKDATGRPLNSICFMAWDLVCDATAFRGAARSSSTSCTGFVDREILSALRGILTMPHTACQEAALHGLGHLCQRERNGVQDLIDWFLSAGIMRDQTLRDYALHAREGTVL